MVAFPPPPVTIRQRSSTCVEPLCPLRRVLSKGSHSFLFEWFEKVSQPSLAEPFGSDLGVIELTVRLSLLSLGRRHPIAVPSSVSMAVTFVTGCLYASLYFGSIFCVFYLLHLGDFSSQTKIVKKIYHSLNEETALMIKSPVTSISSSL